VVHEAASVGFSRSAEAYDRARPDYPAAAIERFCVAVGIEPGSRVLDVGAGTGKLTAPLAERGAEVLAVEPVAEMRARIAERTPRATAVAGVAERLPADDGWADAIVAGQAFHWFATERALAEFARCLRPEGRLGLIWNRRSANDELQRRITALLEPVRGDAPRHAMGAWREVFERPEPFTQVDGFELEFVQELDRDGLLDRVGSISFVAALEPERRRGLLAQVAELCPEGSTVELPYICEAFVYGRRPTV
jgi:ubiquinone/menaquinone biosynthesis C-methylase UbiE